MTDERLDAVLADLATEYGTALSVGRIAPVSREMVLNFVGSFSLGLPKSY